MSWLREWFDNILEAILTIPENFKQWFHQWELDRITKFIDSQITVKGVQTAYDELPPEWHDDKIVKIYYEARLSQVKAAGFNDMGDVTAGFIGTQIRKAVGLVTSDALGNLQPEFNKFYEKESIPKEAQDSINAIAKSGEFGLNAVVGFMLGHFLSPVLTTSLAPAWETMGQEVWKALPKRLIDSGRLVDLTFRDAPNAAKYDEQLARYGYNDENIAALKKQFEFIPSPRDVILWAVREAFYPDYIKEYGLHDEYPADAMKKYGSLSGLPTEYAEHFWHSHWELPSLSMGYEMLHRSVPGKMSPNSEHVASFGGKDYNTVIGAKDLSKLFMAQDIMPWWRKKLEAISYHPITRVDLRRMWDMKVITRPQLYKGYRDLGYNDENAELMTLWTVIYVLSGDLRDRYKKGWITELQVKEELIAVGMAEERAIEWVRTIVKAVKGVRVEKERDLTKTDITKGVKKGVIKAEEGISLLQDMGYDAEEAEFIIVSTVGKLTGSPESFQEFKAITERYKKAMGQKSEIPTEEVFKAEKEYKKKRTPETELKYRDLLKQLAEKEEEK